jgi:hypothetical protein
MAFAPPFCLTPRQHIVTTGHSRSQNGVLWTSMPVVHTDSPHTFDCRMDCRGKPGNDAVNSPTGGRQSEERAAKANKVG